MAESVGGTCDVVLNLDQPTCRSRLPKPLKSDRQRRLSLSQPRTSIASPSESRLKFPQLEMTKNANSNIQTKIPQLSNSFKNDSNVVNWLKLRPQTSVETSSCQRAYTATERRVHYHQQLKSIEGLNSRSNSSEEHKFGKFTTLPAIGMSRPNTADTFQSPTQENSDFIVDTDFINIDSSSDINANTRTNSETEKIEITPFNESVDECDNNLIEFNDALTPDTALDEIPRTLIRSETYDILPTLNEEENDNCDNDSEIVDSDNEENNLATIHMAADAILSSDEDVKRSENKTLKGSIELVNNDCLLDDTTENQL